MRISIDCNENKSRQCDRNENKSRQCAIEIGTRISHKYYHGSSSILFSKATQLFELSEIQSSQFNLDLFTNTICAGRLVINHQLKLYLVYFRSSGWLNTESLQNIKCMSVTGCVLFAPEKQNIIRLGRF